VRAASDSVAGLAQKAELDSEVSDSVKVVGWVGVMSYWADTRSVPRTAQL
jgi:hypothetical protein